MSRHHFVKVAERELQSLNRAIDQKIISGISYAKEAKRHKFLSSNIARFRQAARPSIFARLASLVF